MECGDQVLRNFLNGLVIHLRGTKENPKNPKDVLAKHKAEIPVKEGAKEKTDFKAKPKTDFKKKPSSNPNARKQAPKVQVVEKVKFNNGKNKKS
jgi:hypothetical protein